MEMKDIANLQSQRGSKVIADSTKSNIKTLEEIEARCREHIENNAKQYRNKAANEKKEAIRSLVVEYVLQKKPLVEGFVTDANEPDTSRLIEKLVQDITDRGKLTSPLDDPSVSEIRLNGREIKIERSGKIYNLTDSDGNVVRFNNVEEQEVILKTLMGDKKLTPLDAIQSARTSEGYRIEAIHSSAVSPDPRDHSNDGYHVAVIRKFSENKPSLTDLVPNGTLTDDMAKLLKLCAIGDFTFWTVGPTGCGKTTMNNAIINCMTGASRMILIQNPSEIDARQRDPLTGRIVNDVVHLEATSVENPTKHDPTEENLMVACNRLSPDKISIGEIRRPQEFKLGYDIGLDGHPWNVTFHSFDTASALRRYMSQCLACSSGESPEMLLEVISSQVDLIITCKKLKDGSRKIIQISEVIDTNGEGTTPKYNDIYRFIPDRRNEYDANGNLTKITGKHVRVGKISDKLCEKLAMAGVREEHYEFFTRDLDQLYVETYKGEPINF